MQGCSDLKRGGKTHFEETILELRSGDWCLGFPVMLDSREHVISPQFTVGLVNITDVAEDHLSFNLD